MGILDVIMSAQGGEAVRQLGAQVGLGEDQTASALSALVPALAAGFQQNVQSQDGMASLISALTSGDHQRYVTDPSALAHAGAVADGNGILGHVFGSKDVSRAVATQAAAQTGISADVLKQMLPLAATLMMGAFAQHQRSAGSAPSMSVASGSGGFADVLSTLVDRNRDGSVADDLGSLVGGF